MNIPFLNRAKDLKKVISDIKAYKGVNRAFFVIAKSGIGKSSFCNEVISTQNLYPSVKLNLSPSRLKFQQEGYYLRELCIRIDELSQLHEFIPSFSEFWRSNASKDIAKDMSEFLLKELSKSNIVTKSVKYFSDSVKDRANFSARAMFEISSSSIINNAVDYLEYVFRKTQLLINIENIQCIDPVSLEKLAGLLKLCQGQYLLLEHTKKTDSPWNIDELCSELLASDVSIEKHHLERLSVDDILKLFDTHPQAILELIKELYIDSDGSLTALKHYNVKFNSNEQPIAYLTSLDKGSIGQITIDLIDELASDEKQILALFAAHGDWVSIDLAKLFEEYIFEASPFLDIDLVIQILSGKQLLDYDSKLKRVRCDEKIQTIFDSKGFEKFKVIAVGFWVELYSKILKDPSESLISKSEIYYFLIYFNLLNHSADSSLNLIDEISYLALNSYSPSKLILLLTDIRYKLTSVGNTEYLEVVDKRLIDILVSLSYSENALELVENLKESAEKHIYKGSILENCGKADLALETATTLRSKYGDKSSKYKATADLIEFASLRALGKMEVCKKLFFSMEENKDYQNLFEYGFVLRSAASALTAKECIPFVERSISFFNNRNAFVQEGFSRIELSVAYSVCREYQQAESILDECSDLLANKISERHTIYNNKACLKMLSGGNIEEAYLLLKQARQTATLGFDRLAVANNMFISLSLIKPSLAEASIERLIYLIEQGGFQSKGIIRKAYYNIGIHYHYLGNEIDASKFFEKMKSVEAVIRHKKMKDRSFIHDRYGHEIGGKPFSPVLMAHWNMEFNNFSEMFLKAS